MIERVEIKSFSFDSVKRRVLKFLGRGRNDTQEHKEAMPFGYDAGARQGQRAICVQTGDGKRYVLGYLCPGHKADVGEVRIYSTDADGAEQTYLWLKNDGTIELAGDQDNPVAYTDLDNAVQQFVGALQAELGLIQAGIAAAGGSYSPSTLQFDISNAKINELKTP